MVFAALGRRTHRSAVRVGRPTRDTAKEQRRTMKTVEGRNG
jgi:hypothetical protein